MISLSQVLEAIQDSIDSMDYDDLAQLYNEITANETITGDEIVEFDD